VQPTPRSAPIALAGLPISVEPLSDMGRTAVNVNGAMTAAPSPAASLGQTDRAVFRGEDKAAPGTATGATAPRPRPALAFARRAEAHG
jgi:Na+/H+-dicarboxylate symporter